MSQDYSSTVDQLQKLLPYVSMYATAKTAVEGAIAAITELELALAAANAALREVDDVFGFSQEWDTRHTEAIRRAKEKGGAT